MGISNYLDLVIKTKGDENRDLKTYIENMIGYCIMQNWYDSSKRNRVSGERQKFLRLLQQENESIASWETRIRNQAAQCEYQDFADDFMRDQFIAGLKSDALRVKLIGKGHWHKTTQAKVKIGEVVEVAKNIQGCRGNHVRESAKENSQKYTARAG